MAYKSITNSQYFPHLICHKPHVILVCDTTLLIGKKCINCYHVFYGFFLIVFPMHIKSVKSICIHYP